MKKHDVPDALLASLLADYKKPEDLIGENGLLKQLTKLPAVITPGNSVSGYLGFTRRSIVWMRASNSRGVQGLDT